MDKDYTEKLKRWQALVAGNERVIQKRLDKYLEGTKKPTKTRRFKAANEEM